MLSALIARSLDLDQVDYVSCYEPLPRCDLSFDQGLVKLRRDCSCTAIFFLCGGVAIQLIEPRRECRQFFHQERNILADTCAVCCAQVFGGEIDPIESNRIIQSNDVAFELFRSVIVPPKGFRRSASWQAVSSEICLSPDPAS
jgi:hypothetical protein